MGVSAQQGACTAVWLATSPDVGRGEYYYRKCSRYAHPIVYDKNFAQDHWNVWSRATSMDIDGSALELPHLRDTTSHAIVETCLQ